MYELCRNSRVVVQLTMPSTNFLECIFIDQPVVGIDTNNMATDIIEPFLKFFHEVGVLHQDAKSVVRFLNDVDLYPWWRQVIEEWEYKKFKQTFARSKICMELEGEGPQ